MASASYIRKRREIARERGLKGVAARRRKMRERAKAAEEVGRIVFEGDEDACTYTGECECGRVIEVSTQDGIDVSEYVTTVYVRCTCGKSVRFELPVN